MTDQRLDLQCPYQDGTKERMRTSKSKDNRKEDGDETRLRVVEDRPGHVPRRSTRKKERHKGPNIKPNNKG